MMGGSGLQAALLGVAAAGLTLASCGEGAPTPSPGEGAVGFVNQQGAGAAQHYPMAQGVDAGPVGQTPATGAAMTPSELDPSGAGSLR